MTAHVLSKLLNELGKIDKMRGLWSSAGKGLTSWLSFVVSNCEFITFPLVSWVRCGT